MAILQTTLCAVLMVTLATSKPVCLSEGDDSAKSSESSEANSSEEAATHTEPSQEPLQPALTDTGIPNAMEETDPQDTAAPLPSVDSGLSPSTHNTSDPEDPQTSTDALQLMPDDPSQTAPGTDLSQHMADNNPAAMADTVHIQPDAEVSLTSGVAETDRPEIVGTCGTNPPPITSTYQGFPKGATPPFPPHIIKPTSPFTTAAPMPIPFSTALTGVPVCFTFQLSTSEPDPPRGDNM